MYLKIITIANIATPDGRCVVLLKAGNHHHYHHEQYDWPRSPDAFNKSQVSIWQIALLKTILNPHGGPSARTIRPTKHLGAWTNKSALDKWSVFYSRVEDHIYKYNGSLWTAYGKYSGRGNHHRYCQTTNQFQDHPELAFLLATLSSIGALFKIDNYDTWNYCDFTAEDDSNDDGDQDPTVVEFEILSKPASSTLRFQLTRLPYLLMGE